VSTPRLEVRDIHQSFGNQHVLDGADLSVEPGEVLALMGESGSGKTTLGRIIAGFDAPQAGEVLLDGGVVAGAGTFVAPESRHVGVVPQEGALFPHLSVAANVAFGLPRNSGRSARVQECLGLVGLDGFGDRRPHELSGGQQQRVALARALAPAPRLVVLDEPFSALDASLRVEVAEQVTAALAAVDATALLITHDAGEAFRTADRVAVIAGGRVVQTGPPIDLYDRPRTAEVAAAAGWTLTLPGVRDRDAVQTSLGRVPSASIGHDSGVDRGDLLIRPGHVVVEPTGDETLEIVAVRTFTEHIGLTIRLDDGSTIVVPASRRSGTPFRPGDHVAVRLTGAAAFLAASTSEQDSSPDTESRGQR
jgi:iron(III) transport system ATP-binding protein